MIKHSMIRLHLDPLNDPPASIQGLNAMIAIANTIYGKNRADNGNDN